MTHIRAILAVALMGACCGTAAAADRFLPPPSLPPAVEDNYWDGFYAGIGAAYESWIPADTTSDAVTVTGKVGANVTIDQILLGAEAYLTGYYQTQSNDPTFSAKVGADGRAGFLVTETALLFGHAGAYYDGTFGPDAIYATVGAGGELSVTENLSVELRYTLSVDVDTPQFYAHGVGVSTNWHF